MCSESTDQLTRGKGTDTEPTPGSAVERKRGRLGLMAYYPGEYNRPRRTVRRMHKPSRETASVTLS